MSETIQGGCFCGAVQLEVSGEPVAMGYCHCRDCAHWSAGPNQHLHAVAAGERESHPRRRAHRVVQQNPQLLSQVVHEVWRPSLRRAPRRRAHRCLRADHPGPRLQADDACLLRREDCQRSGTGCRSSETSPRTWAVRAKPCPNSQNFWGRRASDALDSLFVGLPIGSDRGPDDAAGFAEGIAPSVHGAALDHAVALRPARSSIHRQVLG